MKIWTDLFSVLSQITSLTDRQTDGRTEFSSLDRVSIPCSAVKTDRQKHNRRALHNVVGGWHCTVTDLQDVYMRRKLDSHRVSFWLWSTFSPCGVWTRWYQWQPGRRARTSLRRCCPSTGDPFEVRPPTPLRRCRRRPRPLRKAACGRTGSTTDYVAGRRRSLAVWA